jgi:hypothetical protein
MREVPGSSPGKCRIFCLFARIFDPSGSGKYTHVLVRVPPYAGLVRETYTVEILLQFHEYLKIIRTTNSRCQQRIQNLTLEKATMSYVQACIIRVLSFLLREGRIRHCGSSVQLLEREWWSATSMSKEITITYCSVDFLDNFSILFISVARRRLQSSHFKAVSWATTGLQTGYRVSMTGGGGPIENV